MAGLVELTDLVVRFHARTGLFRTVAIDAVAGVSLAIEAGETVALVGESGSGKTTLGRASLRLVRPASGSVRFAGRDITGVPERELKEFRREAQAVFQDPYASINPYLTVRETVEEPLAIHGIGTPDERADRVRKALEDVQLRPAEGFLPTYPHLLSGAPPSCR